MLHPQKAENTIGRAEAFAPLEQFTPYISHHLAFNPANLGAVLCLKTVFHKIYYKVYIFTWKNVQLFPHSHEIYYFASNPVLLA